MRRKYGSPGTGIRFDRQCRQQIIRDRLHLPKLTELRQYCPIFQLAPEGPSTASLNSPFRDRPPAECEDGYAAEPDVVVASQEEWPLAG